MGTTDIALERIFRQLIAGNAGVAMAEVNTYLGAWPNPQTQEKLDAIRADYRRMEDYWRQGFDDPQREAQYLLLLQRVYVLSANIAIHRHIVASSYLQSLYAGVRQRGRSWSLDVVRREMENFVSEVAMLSLEPEHTRSEKSLTLYKEHQQQMNQLFNFVLTSNMWTDGVGHAMEEILLSPTIDSNDQQLLTSAIMLSLMNRFDMVKFRLLLNVYRAATDEAVRQRALVGWVMGIDDDFLAVYPGQLRLVADLLKSKRAVQELTELQIQLVYTLNADKDTATMEREIMPDLLKNNAMRITKNGIEEIEDDPLEDVLHPDAAEERMEKLEAAFQRMMDMQRQGADIYFGGFSQMKRLPFFYECSNWFVPFYMQHPDIASFVKRMEGNRFLDVVMKRGPFCNSDKYSFIMAFQKVMDYLPDNLRQMMHKGEVAADELGEETQQSPAFIRRSYLMDLYRFFRLFPNRSALCNPFDTSKQPTGMCLFFGSALFRGTPLEQKKPEIVSVLMKQKLGDAALELLDTFPESLHDVQYYLWTGNYEQALALDGSNERALAGHAREAYQAGRLDDAADDYERLLLLHPGKSGYMLNRAVCLAELEEYEGALKLLYQLNYEQPDNQRVTRVLAWTLMSDGKLEQADRLYQQLADSDKLSDEDFLNRGYCLWLMGRIDEAADSIRKYIEETEASEYDTLFDAAWLQRHGIGDMDMKMMEGLVADVR